jgi:PadR family transcriptional regulator, regulatory protein PadR
MSRFFEVEEVIAKRAQVGTFEQLVLLALLRLRQDAYGLRVRDEIAIHADRRPSLGAVYTTLDRLESKGLVSSREGEKTAVRGGRAKRYFQIEAPGIMALKWTRDATSKMTKGLESILEAR